jgi:hypothetical protein
MLRGTYRARKKLETIVEDAGWVLRATCYVLRATCYVLRATCYVLRATCYVLRATCYTLRATCYVLRSTVLYYVECWSSKNEKMADFLGGF